jgi:hypothetical protein
MEAPEEQMRLYKELYGALDGEHEEQETVCKLHLGLTLRVINENIDENPEESSFTFILGEIYTSLVISLQQVLQILEGQDGEEKVEFNEFKASID